MRFRIIDGTGGKDTCFKIATPVKWCIKSETSKVLLAVRKLGFTATELYKKLGVSQPTVSISVKRGEEIAKSEQL